LNSNIGHVPLDLSLSGDLTVSVQVVIGKKRQLFTLVSPAGNFPHVATDRKEGAPLMSIFGRYGVRPEYADAGELETS